MNETHRQRDSPWNWIYGVWYCLLLQTHHWPPLKWTETEWAKRSQCASCDFLLGKNCSMLIIPFNTSFNIVYLFTTTDSELSQQPQLNLIFIDKLNAPTFLFWFHFAPVRRFSPSCYVCGALKFWWIWCVLENQTIHPVHPPNLKPPLALNNFLPSKSNWSLFFNELKFSFTGTLLLTKSVNDVGLWLKRR